MNEPNYIELMSYLGTQFLTDHDILKIQLISKNTLINLNTLKTYTGHWSDVFVYVPGGVVYFDGDEWLSVISVY